MTSTVRFDGYAMSVTPSVLERGSTGLRPGFRRIRHQRDAALMRSVSAVIESEIIPRLMLAHETVTTPAVLTVSEPAVATAEVEEFAPLVLQVEADALLAHVEAILARGVAFDTLLVELLAPTARLLGEFWEEDRCDFIDVTMGLWRLQEVVNEISSRLPTERLSGDDERRALFTSLPGDQHSFGATLVDEVFRRHGWTTDRLIDADSSELLRRTAESWFDLVGLTVTCDCHTAHVASIIVALRNVSRNPRVCVLVGGRVFSADPDLARQVGADGTARDADLALKLACELVPRRSRCAA